MPPTRIAADALRTAAGVLLCLVLAACAGLGLDANAREQFEKGLSLYNQGRYEQAAPYFQKAVDLEPEYAEAYLYLGRSQLNLGRYSEAVGPLRTAYRLDPQLAQGAVLDVLIDAVLGAAVGELSRGNLQGSLDYLNQGLELAPQGSPARSEVGAKMLHMGGERLTRGDYRGAVDLFDAFLKSGTGGTGMRANAYLGLANAFLRSGQYMNALEAAGSALRLNPSLDTQSGAAGLLNRLR